MVVETALVLVAVGLSIAAGQLLANKNKNLVQDDKPTTLATRGSFVPLVKGRRRVGAIVGFAGNRYTTKEKGGSKGGSFGVPKIDVYRENGWHQLAIGPVWALHEIEQNGKVIFKGPITSVSHPSGSLIDLGSEGKFRIFWGQDTQPINTYLGDSSRIGISSRWPGLCYIEWRDKRMGQQPVWPTLTYTIETRPQTVHLLNTPGYIEETFTLSGDSYAITGRSTGSPGTGYWQLAGVLTDRFAPGMKIRVTGNTGLGINTDYTIRAVGTADIGSGMGFPPTVQLVTRIFPNETIAGGATADGNIVPYVGSRDDGWNGAHLLAELLFDPWPRGAGLSKNDWDMTSLEDLGTLLAPAGENLRCSVVIPEGQELRSILGGLMQDFGTLLPLDMTTGKLRWLPVREPTGTLPHIPTDGYTGYVEVDNRVGGTRFADRVVFSFSDETNNYRDMTIGADSDGQIQYHEYFKARTVQLICTVHFDSASRIAARRGLEELAESSTIRIPTSRGARTLLPGQAFTADECDEILRVSSVRTDRDSGFVEVSCTTDFYGLAYSNFVIGRGRTGGSGNRVASDLAVKILEVPETITGAGGPQTAIILAIRAHGAISGHNLHLSVDNSTYTFFAEDLTIVTGGTLIDPLPVTSALELAQGPTFTVLGPDISSALDLSSDPAGWRSGRQLAVFVDATTRAAMIAFLQKVTALGPTTYRLDGLILGRYDTPLAQTFSAGTQVFIFQNDDGLAIQDPLLAPASPLYIKAEPLGIGTLPLANIAPEAITLYGKGIRPVPVSGVRLSTGSDSAGSGTANRTDKSYKLVGSSPGDDLAVTWSYSTPQTPGSGAGAFGWGSLVSNVAPEGDFTVEILDAANVLKRTAVVSSPSYTYTRADRIADFTSEPASFKVRVTQRRGGYSSSSVTETFTSLP